MNIFILSTNPQHAAQYMHDRHVVKMILESYQMLSTNIRRTEAGTKFFKDWSHIESTMKNDPLNETAFELLSKATHENHPCTKWARESSGNALWLARHLNFLCQEYTHRFGGKIHSYQRMATVLLYFHMRCFDRDNGDSSMTPFALAMPDKYKTDCAVTSYRRYYAGEKIFQSDCRWTSRGMPHWLNAGEFPGHIADRIRSLQYRPIAKLNLVKPRLAGQTELPL